MSSFIYSRIETQNSSSSSRREEAGAMAEISEAAPSTSDSIENKDEKSITPEEASQFDPQTMRKTKPGRKRLFLTLIVLISFLLGSPFLLKSIEIYRSPLPFGEIDSLSTSIESNPVVFPCNFRAVFVNFDSTPSTLSAANELGFSVQAQMQKLTSKKPSCGACADNFTVSVALDSSSNCISNQNVETSSFWKCGVLDEFKLGENSEDFDRDRDFDEFLETVLENGEKVYTAVVVNKNEEVRTVVGKFRHAWIVGRVEKEAAVQRIAETFVKVFVNGAREDGLIHGEFMPVGADGKVVLSFNLLNADPRDWIYDWDFQEIDESLLAPIIEALRPVADVTAESQVLYHAPKSSFSYWDEQQKSNIFNIRDLPFFVNSNEWHLDTSTAAGGRSKVLQFVVYVPSATECPLFLQLPDGRISRTNGFISPMWGGIIVWNPPACSQNSESIVPLRHKISQEELKKAFEIFLGQLRQLFGLKSDSLYIGASGISTLLPSDRGFTQWELDVLLRQHTCSNLLQCGTTLGSLSRLVQSLPRMIIKDEIGKQVKFSFEAAKLALSNASVGSYDDAAVSLRQARSLAEDAFFHPSMMSVSYYSFEHCFAVYSPFFLPVSLHVLLAVLRELKRYKQENKKYLAWKAREK